jgi:hypothetical protein
MIKKVNNYLYQFTAYIIMSLGLGIAALPYASELTSMFSSGCYILSGILILYGYFLLRKTYHKRKGIALNPRWLSKFGDTIFIISLGFTAYSALAWGIDMIFQNKIYLYDTEPMTLQVAAMFWLPSAAFTAFFTSNMDTQSIEINKNGIIIHYTEKDVKLAWKNLNRIELKDTSTIMGGDDWAAPRHMQTKLSIETNEDTFSIFEPGLKRTKKQIIYLLRNNAPEKLHGDINAVEKNW